MVLGFLVMADSILESYWLAKLQIKLEDNLKLARHSSQLMEDRQLRSLLASKNGIASSGLKEVFHTLELIEEENYERALVKLKKRTFPNISGKDELLYSLERVEAAKNSTDDGADQMDRLDRKKVSLNRQLKLISDDMLLIFKKDRASLTQRVNWETELPKQYESGPLKSLPLLRGVPRNIETKEELTEYLAGTYVEATGEHLESLRNRMAKLVTEAERYQFITKDVQSALKNTNVEVEKLKLQTRKLIGRAIFELAKPKENGQDKWLYDSVSQIAAKAGYNLPPVAYRGNRKNT